MTERTKYSPTTSPGQTRVRIRAGHFFNPLNGVPTISGLECEVVRIEGDGEKQLADTRTVTVTFTPGKTFPGRNPLTDELTGETKTHDQLFADIYALMRDAAVEMDQQGTVP